MGAAKPTTTPVKQDMGGAGVLMAATAEPTSNKPGIRAKGIADVRFASGGQAKLVIKDINLQELIGVFRRDGALPQLLEQAVLDIVDKESGRWRALMAMCACCKRKSLAPMRKPFR